MAGKKRPTGKKTISITPKDIRQLGHSDIPATIGLVNEVAGELHAAIDATHHELRAEIMRVDTRLEAMGNDLRAEIRGVDSKVTALDNKVTALDNKIEIQGRVIDQKLEVMRGEIKQILAISHKTGILMEEQRHENKIVLDGLKTCMDRHDRTDMEIKELTARVRFVETLKQSPR